MWYYIYQHQQMGPVDTETIRTLIAEQKILTGTLVWKNGMAAWMPILQTELAALFNLDNMVSVPDQEDLGFQSIQEIENRIKELDNLYQWFWICLLCSVVTLGVSAIASVVFFSMILHRGWQLIQDDGFARTTPNKAVGYNFIPFYNFYWIFQSILGLVKDTNAYIQRNDLPILQQDERLAIAFCILCILCVVPYVNLVVSVVVIVLLVLLTKKIKDTSIFILHSQE